MNFFYVILGGGIGAGLRYMLQLFIGKSNGHQLPVSTLIANLSGCLLIGIVAGLSLKYKWNEHQLLFVMTGLLGGYTTFSSFSIEIIQLLKNNHFGLALIYLGLSNFVGLGLCYFGFLLTK